MARDADRRKGGLKSWQWSSLLSCRPASKGRQLLKEIGVSVRDFRIVTPNRSQCGWANFSVWVGSVHMHIQVPRLRPICLCHHPLVITYNKPQLTEHRSNIFHVSTQATLFVGLLSLFWFLSCDYWDRPVVWRNNVACLVLFGNGLKAEIWAD